MYTWNCTLQHWRWTMSRARLRVRQKTNLKIKVTGWHVLHEGILHIESRLIESCRALDLIFSQTWSNLIMPLIESCRALDRIFSHPWSNLFAPLIKLFRTLDQIFSHPWSNLVANLIILCRALGRIVYAPLIESCRAVNQIMSRLDWILSYIKSRIFRITRLKALYIDVRF